ncbi:glycosyl hydrolase [Mucilaginibacter flavus]|uniref:glycosyl hydrolase n=1 Tax=Mucilaginibacter flavus TaxID=931504 RepID=UPI0025B3B2CF|nr:glycosyl hydrolase [Mucilaginibacter flavus]MDN3582988.1 glycosyl hydrolase [Mucilaginibacter flavus]
MKLPITALLLFLLFTNPSNAQVVASSSKTLAVNPEKLFTNPPESAKPGVLWMWMGANVTEKGITKDLEALKDEGFNSTTMLGLADITTPWANQIAKDPTPDVIAWTEPWWKLVQHAARESKRLNMTMGLFNGAGYATSGGVWITPELSMQELCFSKKNVSGGKGVQVIDLDRPTVNLKSNERFPVYDPQSGKVEIPDVPERKSYYRDIVVLAMPAKDVVTKLEVIDLSTKMDASGKLTWEPPTGDWTIYRFGHTTMGAKVQPAQWQATGFECDKMSQEAVDFHIDHIVGELKSHLGEFVGNTVDHVYFDSAEENDPTWTPKMREQFSLRRGYDLYPYLAAFAGRIIEGREQTSRFKDDFYETIQDLYHEVYFATIAKKLKAANLKFFCEPYGGPWRSDDVLPNVTNVMGEFWTHDGVYAPYELEPVITSLRRYGQNILAAEAFTGLPQDSKWTETPAWLKSIGDEAFCVGVNKIMIHRFVHQPWDDKYQPGNSMGQWGTHFDRTQTWWKPAKAFVSYLQRCDGVLQWGHYVPKSIEDFSAAIGSSNMVIKDIHRKDDNADIYFVANVSRYSGQVNCSFNITSMQPELWDPVSGEMREIAQFKQEGKHTVINLRFVNSQSFFIVFRKKVAAVVSKRPNFPSDKSLLELNGPWKVKFDSKWGGPQSPVTFAALTDWTDNTNKGIKYYSGTAVYSKSFNLPDSILKKTNRNLYLDLGIVNCIAKVFVNDKEVGVVWTAPWRIKVPVSQLKTVNQLKIEVSNVWANRLIGDEQEPADCEWLPGHQKGGEYLKEFPDWFLQNNPRPSSGRFCFTTWKYFDKKSELVASGLLGPVRLVEERY